MKTILQIRKTIILIAILTFMQGCSQKTKQNKSSMEYTEKIGNLYKEIKVYDHNPSYYVFLNNKNCTYEIYINDVLVDYSFSTGISAGEQPIPISAYILKSGIQSIKYKIYPKAITNGILNKYLDETAYFTARVTLGDALHLSVQEKDNKEILSFKLPPQDKSDLPYFEYLSKFEAKVPYELKGWIDGVDLTKEDPKKLEEEVWGKMEEIKKMYESKDIEGIAKLQYNYLKEYYQALFYNTPNEWLSQTKETLEENYKYVLDKKRGKLVLMGNGKIVSVLQEGNNEYRNDSAFLGISKESYNFFKLYFYRPKAGAPLEVVR